MGRIEEQAKFWYASAGDAWDTAQFLYKGKRNPEALFFCQLALEKLLKGLVTLATQETPPYIHDLVRLAVRAGIELSTEHRELLTMITGFNLQARYDDEKTSFRKVATTQFTNQYMMHADMLRLWLQKKYPSGYND